MFSLSATPSFLPTEVNYHNSLRCTFQQGQSLLSGEGSGLTLVSGEGSGLTLGIAVTSRHHAGHYTCHADNGWGQPANAPVRPA